jgi:hypothetical protein
MTTFSDEFEADCGDDLLDEFGETVTYRPRGGGTRSITGIVITNPLGEVGSIQDAPAVRIHIRVLNDSTLGISGAELNLGGDKIDAPLRDGGTATTLAIKELVSDNGGFLTVAAY